MSKFTVNLPMEGDSDNRVPVTDLEVGTVFESDYADEFGVRTEEGWVAVNLDNELITFTNSELPGWDKYKRVTPRPDLQCTITIGRS